MFHKTIFLVFLLATSLMTLRSSGLSKRADLYIIALAFLAVVIVQRSSVENFEEAEQAGGVKSTEAEEETKKTDDEEQEEEQEEEEEEAGDEEDDKEKTTKSKSGGKDAATNEESKVQASSSKTASKSSNDITKNFEPFKDTFPKDFDDRDLTFYVSTFDARNISKDNALLNHQQSDSDENFLQVPADLKTVLTQRDGLLMNFKQPLTTVYPREIKFNSQEFTIMWYGKFVPMKHEGDITKQHVYFINIPVHDSTNIVGIEFEFRNEYVNPTIKLHWKGKEVEGGTYKFESISSDSDKSKNFFDNRFHLFTLTKTKSNEMKLSLDDQTHTSEPLINTIIKSEENPVINEKNSYKITLNSNIEDPTSIDDKTAAKSPNVALNMHLCALAIFNRAIDYADVSKAYKYFEGVRYTLDPRTSKIQNEMELMKTSSSCPFTDKSLCSTPNCAKVDWRDQGAVISNERCVKDVFEYCSSKDTYANDKMCTFYDRDNAAGIVSLLEPEVKKAGEASLSEAGIEEDKLVKQLKKLGINNIHLDKSLRAEGKYSDEINQLIDKIYEQKQLNVKGLSSLEEVEDLKHSPLNYNELMMSGKPTGKQSNSDSTNSGDLKSQMKNKHSQLMDLKYSDLEDYDATMQEYESSTASENGSRMGGAKKKTSFLDNIFR